MRSMACTHIQEPVRRDTTTWPIATCCFSHRPAPPWYSGWETCCLIPASRALPCRVRCIHSPSSGHLHLRDLPQVTRSTTRCKLRPPSVSRMASRRVPPIPGPKASPPPPPRRTSSTPVPASGSFSRSRRRLSTSTSRTPYRNSGSCRNMRTCSPRIGSWLLRFLPKRHLPHAAH